MNKFDVKALRDKVMQTDDVKYDSIKVDEWGVELPVRTIMGDKLKKVMKYKDDPVRMTCMALIYGCVTPDGEAVFTEKDLPQFEQNKSFKAITHVARRVFELSGLDEDAVDEAKND
jgi:hypothetical protein